MSEHILTLLNSQNPTQRKRGISAAAKSADRRYLKPLGRIYKTDPDPALRELAKKAGIYINKQQPEPATAASARPTAAPSVDDDLMALRDDTLSATPPPTDLPDLGTLLSAATPQPPTPSPAAEYPQQLVTAKAQNPGLAQMHYNNAFDLSLQGNNGMAALELGTAFHLNPAYATDAIAVAFAAELTGVPKEQAAAYISNPRNWKTITNQHGVTGTRPNTTTNSLLLWIGGGIGFSVIVVILLIVVQSDAFMTVLQQASRDLFGTGFGVDAGPPR